jgi:tripartite-type tricarboxylate transporter receptor subunit TctC
MLRRGLLIGAALAVPGGARANAWPAKRIRLVLPGPAGGLIDQAARAISEVMQLELGQPIIIDPRPGGSGIVAGQIVSTAAPDGYTLLLTVSTHVTLPFLMKVPFDVLADFTPIAMIGVSSGIICVPRSRSFANLAQLVEYARAHPGKLSYLNPGNGTSSHLIPEQLKLRYGIDMTAISYLGLPPGLQDLLGGRIDLGLLSTGIGLGHVKSGAVKAIAIVGPNRLPDLPDVPTMTEQGMGDMEVQTALPLLGPRNLPAPIVARLDGAVRAALAKDEVKRRFASAYIEAMPLSPLELARFLSDEHARLGALIRQVGIKADGSD